MRKLARSAVGTISKWVVAATVLLGASGSCMPATGSETNWLGGCAKDKDCGSGSCLCGVCSLACADDSACGPVSEGARCRSGVSSAYTAQCGGPAPVEKGLCLMGCQTNADCGSAAVCTDGTCTPISVHAEPLVLAESPPAPISGGTLALLVGGTLAAVSDPDQHRVFIANLDALSITATIELSPGDEPGRIVEDAQGRIHVVLRRADAIASIDPVSGAVLSRRAVCQDPRGIAFDAASGLLHVACVDGRLVSLPAAGGVPTRVVQLDTDLRDVIVYGQRLLVSRFRSAELLVLDTSGSVVRRMNPPPVHENGVGTFRAAVAWRTVAAPPAGVLMVHQQMSGEAAVVVDGSWGSEGIPGTLLCRDRVRAVVTLMDPEGQPVSLAILPTVLPVDLALRAETGQVMVASAAARPDSVKAQGLTSGRSLSLLPALQTAAATDGAVAALPDPEAFCNGGAAAVLDMDGQVVAVAFDGKGRVLAQTRQPSTLVIGTQTLALPGASVRDTGHELFHLATRSGLACASCHPEGGDDGRTWDLTGQGQLRTQSLRGGVAGTEPLHWRGEHTDFHSLAEDVMSRGMQGPQLRDPQVVALERFINAIPAWKVPMVEDTSAVGRGRAVFEDAAVACATCHTGPRLTNNQTVDVGTGGVFQVPSLLGLSRRAPFMHNGCAPNLSDRFTDCGGGDAHGAVSQLAPADLSDLVTYLESL